MSKYPTVVYEIFVRSFCDSNADGIGDIPGIISRLDYLSELGIQAIWLTPIHPSPSYHKYDVTDYYGIDPEFGTLSDFKELIDKAHRRGISVYMDLVIHHTSIKHPWFQEAKLDPTSPFRHYYRWMSDEKINEMGWEVREMTLDAHTVNPWHRIKGNQERFLGIFSSEMADLNFDHPPVWEEIESIVTYWLKEVGVDGFRLDAARHIYPIWEDHKNPEFWQRFRAMVESISPEVFLVGEVWADTQHIAPFFRGMHANFNFDLWQRIELVLLTEEHGDLIDHLIYQIEHFREVSPEFINANMLSNHDQQRIGSTVKGHVGKMKLAAALLLTLPGQPYLYYGEEIGMLGKKPDPFLREPFLWGDPRLETKWKSPRYNKPGKVRSLRESKCLPDSIYYCYKTLIGLRNKFPALGAPAGACLERTPIQHPHIMSFVRRDTSSSFLILHNLTGSEQEIRLEESMQSFQIIIYATTQDYSLKGNLVRLGSYNSLILQQDINNA